MNGDEVDSLVEGLGYFSRHGGDAEPGNDDALATGMKYGYGGGFMAYIFLKEVKVSILPSLIRELNFQRSLVKDAYGIFTYNDEGNYQGTTADASISSRSGIDEDDIVEGHQDDLQLSKRAERQSNYWELSQMSVPPGVAWSKSATLPGGPFTESYDTSFGRGQVIYVVEDDFLDDAEFALTYNSPDGGTVTRSAVHKIPMGEDEDFGDIHRGAAKTKHGSEVLSKVWGINLGLAKNAQIVLPLNANGDPTERRNKIQDLYLNSLVRVLQDIDDNYKGRESDCIINMSFGWMVEEMDYMHPAHHQTLYQLLKEFDNRGVVLVAVSHNYDLKRFGEDRLDGWPSRFGNPGASAAESLPNLIVVSGIDQNTRVSPVNPYKRWLVTAPGWDVNVPGGGTADGASLAAPLVAGVIAYWRGLPNMKQQWKDELRDPANVKKLVRFMQRNIPSPGIDVNRGEQPWLDKPQVPFIWTGRVKDGDCLVDPTLKGCPVFTESLADLEDCSGNFCEPTPTGKLPGYYDPLDPDHPFLSDLPTLAPTPTATSCASTEKTTSTMMCAGGNGHSACVTRQVCTKTSEATVEPTPTRPPKDSGMTCYRDNNEDGKWKTFTFAEGEAMYASTCDSGLQLITNGQGFMGGGGDDDNGLRMAFRWADDQSRCKGKQAFDLDKPCHQGFAAINDQCDAGYDSSYGGTYRMQTDYGCVQVSLGRSDTG
ncbi:hypothetical protein E8E14_000151 [Neopestalotiopsis sp. 37M]|nr:hypothetical protein E8E14_000151 [Neopestalotiopsis sp. 37M]